MRRARAGLLLALGAALAAPAPATAGADAAPSRDFALAVMDATPTRAVLWARAPEGERLDVELRTAAGAPPLTFSAPVPPDADGNVAVPLGGLSPATSYDVLAHFASRGLEARASFRTPADTDVPGPVRLVFGGDVGGQNVCRDRARGYPVFETIRALEPDVFVGLGDMIYADGVCRPVGRYGNAQVPGPAAPAVDLEGFRQRWRYNREDPHLRALLASTVYVPVWDDHEVVNDFGPGQDESPAAPGQHLLPDGLQAYLEANPIAGSLQARLHRSLRFGRHLQLYVLDTRQHRDPNAAPDDFAHPKTMLGQGQREWLGAALTISDATWNVVVSSVPISIPTGAFPDAAAGRDGWAGFDQPTGYESELRGILMDAQAAGVRNLLFIGTDAHFAAVIRYQPFTDTGFAFHEVITGPLNAMAAHGGALDPSFSPERLFLHSVPDAGGIHSLDEALRWFNFGLLEVDAAGRLTLRVVDARGTTLFERSLEPEA